MKAKLRVPTELNDISLKQYQEYLKAVEGLENEDLIKQRTIEHFCEVSLSAVLLIKISEVHRICNELDVMFAADKPLIQTFKIGDQEFGMIPNLEEMTFGEYIDLDSYVTDWQNMHKAMAVLFRPITKKVGDKYEILEYEGTDKATEDLMQFAPLGVVMGAMVFFYSLGKELLRALDSSLKAEVVELISQHSNNSMNGGDGISHYTQSLKETLEDLMQLLENPSESV